jgi:hypothetical protein
LFLNAGVTELENHDEKNLPLTIAIVNLSNANKP